MLKFLHGYVTAKKISIPKYEFVLLLPFKSRDIG